MKVAVVPLNASVGVIIVAGAVQWPALLRSQQELVLLLEHY